MDDTEEAEEGQMVARVDFGGECIESSPGNLGR